MDSNWQIKTSWQRGENGPPHSDRSQAATKLYIVQVAGELHRHTLE